MKKILFLLCLLPSLALAKEIAYAENLAGGKIILTDSICTAGATSYPTLHRMYTIGITGETADGCFYVDGNYIVVAYTTGQMFRYPMNSFHVMPGVQPAPTKPKNDDPKSIM